MADITVKLKDKTEKRFPETSRAGGSYCTSIRYEGNFAIISDAYGNETAIPSENIDEIRTSNPRGGW